MHKALLTTTAVLTLLPAAIWCLTVDAPHSPLAPSRPNVTWVIGGSRVTAVIAPFISAATFSSFLYGLLVRSMNATLPGFLSPINPAGVATLTKHTDRLKTEMLNDADARWRHLDELEEYIFTDIEGAWFFQRGDWDLQLRMFPRRAVYYALLWAGAPSPEPPMRTARRRVSELQTFLEHGVAANSALKWQAVAIREHSLRGMEIAVGTYAAKMRPDGEDNQPRDASREQRDAAAATLVIHELLTRAVANSSLADGQFAREPDVFMVMVKELKRRKESLSPNDSAFEGSWARVFESGARALDVLVRLEELTGAIRWLLADVEKPQGKHG
ncbi:hypothetical protein LA080_010234 [Diaporthe eres]|nr:hypothetical protein LA080_010234 [Diaporthe eres]